MDSNILLYKERVFKEIEDIGPSIIELSDWMADNPELSGQEFIVTEKTIDILEKYAFKVTRNYMNLPTAFKGVLKNKGNTNIAFLMEYDALPVIGHGCGHNVSGCISLLASLALSKCAEIIVGGLDIIGTPNEESEGSKVHMSENGAFDNYDFAMMIHMSNDDMITKKFVALDAIEFTFTGKPSHAGTSPWFGINALNGAQLFFHSIDMLRQHVKPDVRMHGVILEGGLGPTPNIVPEKAVVRFHFRAHKRKYLNLVIKKVMDCAKGAAIATQTKVDYKYFEPKVDEMLRNQVAENLVSSVYDYLEIDINHEDEAETISSDVYSVSKICPTIHSYLAICNKNVNLHTREFAHATKSKKAHKAIINGAKIMVLSALNVYYNEALKAELKKDFKKGLELNK